jgi:ABC-type nitrate/sulfonate/bicarbonate transport system permease component
MASADPDDGVDTLRDFYFRYPRGCGYFALSQWVLYPIVVNCDWGRADAKNLRCVDVGYITCKILIRVVLPAALPHLYRMRLGVGWVLVIVMRCSL